jgi:hypothetical protein
MKVESALVVVVEEEEEEEDLWAYRRIKMKNHNCKDLPLWRRLK